MLIQMSNSNSTDFKNPHCECSEASHGAAKRKLDCFAALAMTGDTPSRSRGALHPGFASSSRPHRTEGAGKAGCALHPRSRVQDWVKKRTRAYRFSGGSPAFPAQWFYGL